MAATCGAQILGDERDGQVQPDCGRRRAAVVSAATVTSPSTHAASLSTDDQIAITQAVTGVGLYTDAHDWGRVEALLTDEVTTDYTSLSGGAVSVAPRAQLVDNGTPPCREISFSWSAFESMLTVDLKSR
jgi:hypothetical protein